jgi:hypothetical protein
MRNLVPPLGTMVPVSSEDACLSADGTTYVIRITYDESTEQWVIASRFNAVIKRWVPIGKLKRLGFIVFLNDRLDTKDTHVRISSIQRTGKGAYGDAVQQS